MTQSDMRPYVGRRWASSALEEEMRWADDGSGSESLRVRCRSGIPSATVGSEAASFTLARALRDSV